MPVHGNEMLQEMHNILFTSSYSLDPYAISQDPCTTQNGILEPACHPTSMVHHRLGRAGPPAAAGCLPGGAGPAWAQPMDAICRSEHWEENGSPSSTAQPKQARHCLKTNNPTHRVRVHLIHLPAPQPWLTVTSPSPGGQAQPFCCKQKQIISCSLLFPTAAGTPQRMAGFKVQL